MSSNLVKNCFKSFGSFINRSNSYININNFSTSTRECIKAIERLPKTHPYPFKDKTRNHFPRAKETKRIVTHGFDTRMETSNGRRILMRRILKGRHVLSH